MIRGRIPIVPTVIVALAVLLMVRLGFWQLQRLHEKEALIALYTANASQPPLPLVALFPVQERALFRRTSAFCLSVVQWRTAAGRAADDSQGWRHIASCRTGAEGPGFMADMGISSESGQPRWAGGQVRGRLTAAPAGQSLIERLFRPAPPLEPMIVSDSPAPGLKPAAQPDPREITNNHLSYAVQWFLFAALAAIIYAIALWQRARKVALGAPPG